ncbi:putative quinol monooxygenase [Psychrilyobacter atlanticus]|uniref:putative quinol monooxygenase n=1 Tax=Psychrilyobacter atlanticus TaxID=271091 RepID=UPI00041A5093|nr:putative quinol monooxygenase [Psychrilyobacter atlanticus]
MIKITAKANVKKENIDLYLKVASVLTDASRNEEGNISYGLFQDTENPSTLTFIEEWKSLEAVKIHEESEHFKTNISKLIELAESIDINVYNQVV